MENAEFEKDKCKFIKVERCKYCFSYPVIERSSWNVYLYCKCKTEIDIGWDYDDSGRNIFDVWNKEMGAISCQK